MGQGAWPVLRALTGHRGSSGTKWSAAGSSFEKAARKRLQKIKTKWNPRTRTQTCIYSKTNAQPICDTLVGDTLVGHSCRILLSLLWHTLVGHSYGTLLWDTLVQRSCGTLSWDTLMGHSCRTLLSDTLVGHSCGRLLCDTLVRHSCRILVSDTLVGHSCWAPLVGGHSCGTLLWRTLV